MARLVTAKIDPASLKRFVDQMGSRSSGVLRDALPEIQQEFKAEINRQQQRLSRSGWEAWSKAYADRRDSEYGKPRLTRYKTKLKRTGAMLAGYIEGITMDVPNLSVTVNFPKGRDAQGYDIGIRAKSHQGTIGQPVGVPIRPFQLDRFKTLAFKIFERAVAEGLS